MYQGFPKMRGPLFDKNVRKADLVHMEATPGIEPGNEDFADPCLTAWLCRRGWSGRRGSNPPPQPWQGCALPNELLPQIRRHGGGIGTPSGARTLDTLIKSQVLYQLS